MLAFNFHPDFSRIFQVILIFSSLFTAQISHAQSTTVVISQVYGGGGLTGAPFNADFIELHNVSFLPKSLAGYSIQYGSGAANNLNWSSKFNLPDSIIPAGGYFLIRMTSPAVTGASLSTPDLVVSPDINLGSVAGKLVLLLDTNKLFSGSCPTAVQIVDFVGYGTTAACSETSPAPAASSTLAIFRGNNGCTDTDNNSLDFATGAPSPRNSATTPFICGNPTTPIINTSLLPSFGYVCLNESKTNYFILNGTNLNSSNIDLAPLSGMQYSISDVGPFTNTLSITNAGGSFSDTVFVRFTPTAAINYSGNIVITGGGISMSVNVIVTANGSNCFSASTLNPFPSQCIRNTSSANSFTLTGNYLDGSPIKIAALPGFSFSTSAVGTFTDSLSISYLDSSVNLPVYVRFRSELPVSFSGNIIVSCGAAMIQVPVQASAVSCLSVLGFNPSTGTNRSEVIISGREFTGATSVRFGNLSAYSFQVISDTIIKAIVGTGNTGSVSVITPLGTASKSGFSYIKSRPTIQSFSPAKACKPSDTLLIRGLDFLGTNLVTVGGVSTAFSVLSDSVISIQPYAAATNSGIIIVQNTAGTDTSVTEFINSSQTGLPLTPNPNPFRLCGGAARPLYTNQPDIYSYQCSNGQSGKSISISAPGNYTLTWTDAYGCSGSGNFTVSSFSPCGGFLEMEADSIINYFDTLKLRIKIRNGANIFSVFAYLGYNRSHLKLVSSSPGNYLGDNIINQPPVDSNGLINFGMTKTTGQSGSNGDGIIYEFRFVMVDQLPGNLNFNALRPDYFTSVFSLSRISAINTSGLEPASFDSISMTSKAIACRYYVPVWPGDLNVDKKVTVADLLPIGYFYGSTGPVRPNASLQWQAQPAILWGNDKSSRTSNAFKTFTDGTPDGIIDLADQASIGFNLGRSRNRLMSQAFSYPSVNSTSSALPALKVNIPDTILQPASLPKKEIISIGLGSSTLPVNDVYGIAFDIYFNPADVNIDSIRTDYAGSIFGNLGTEFTRIEDRTALASGRLSIGMTRFNGTAINASGGKLLDLTLPFKQGAVRGWYKLLAVPEACNNASGVPINIGPGQDSVFINSEITCPENYWTGSVDATWENPQNWSCGTVPDSTTIVYVQGSIPNLPVVSSEAYCRKLITGTGITVKVRGGYRLNIVGAE